MKKKFPNDYLLPELDDKPIKKTKKKRLQDEFDNDDVDHFTHYDYLLQVQTNGQYSAFKYHLREITTQSLLRFMEIMPDNQTYREAVKEEILARTKED